MHKDITPSTPGSGRAGAAAAAALTGLLLLATAAAIPLPGQAGPGEGRTVVAPSQATMRHLDVRCRPAAADLPPLLGLTGRIQFHQGHGQAPGALAGVRGALRAEPEGQRSQERLPIVGGSIGRGDSTEGAAVDLRYVSLGFERNALGIESAELVLGPGGHSFLLGELDEQGNRRRYFLDCSHSVLPLAGAPGAATAAAESVTPPRT
jgi:hypothetical protein